MFLNYLPQGFWLSIVAFVTFQWVAIPVIAHLSTSAAGVMMGILFIISVIYPLYLLFMLLYLSQVKKLNGEQLMIAAVFLLIPLFAYIPLVA
ncbi:hypothetical protein [Alteribacter keqinensis]|uniref:Uncharacterized protein n=1 Tax=Alteribacter keqinensis TaxID=2483800 RepID=A0A3M7TPE9_9BACI|nr:hypothetical protein [Alteribacter keqinensis]RNA66897.1 hypothetical protein EBO34_16985 [Alteribacter keqinensis]